MLYRFDIFRAKRCKSQLTLNIVFLIPLVSEIMCLLNHLDYVLFRQLLVPIVLYVCRVNYVGYIGLATFTWVQLLSGFIFLYIC